MFRKFVPAAANKSLPSNFKIKRTGLILRRMFLLPPIGLDFWNRVINLCLQKDDFPKIIHENFSDDVLMFPNDHGLFYQIGNFHLRWKYWRSGIVLELNNQIILSINSLRVDEFTDPMKHSAISETTQKVERLKFYDHSDGYLSLKGTFSEVFEVTVPVIHLEPSGSFPPSDPNDRSSKFQAISSKLLVKGLEIVDEVLRGNSTDLAEDGLYTLSQMCHVIPCPLCFGDKDNRPRHPPLHRAQSEPMRPRLGTAARQVFQNVKMNRLQSDPDHRDGDIVVFSIDQCIEMAISGAEYIECPNHGSLKLEYVSPDIVSLTSNNLFLLL